MEVEQNYYQKILKKIIILRNKGIYDNILMEIEFDFEDELIGYFLIPSILVSYQKLYLVTDKDLMRKELSITFFFLKYALKFNMIRNQKNNTLYEH